MTLLEELKERGLLQDHTPGVEELMSKEQIKGYIGYDPTAPSLTIGNLVTVMLLVHLQRHGHIPVVLFGGATGRIGDPSGKDAERKLLDIEVLERNLNHQKNQFAHILRFDQGENKVEMTNNYDWFSGIGFLDFLRDAGKHLTVNYMMSKESVKRRVETGLSFTEFSYQLVQGYDFFHLNKEMGVKLQMGGSDQWGNITTGTELIRRKGGSEAHAITCPLLTRADGTKFGKSEGQNIWLDRELTSPYKFYQFFVNVGDEEAVQYLKIFSLRPLEELQEVIREHEERKGAKIAQNMLAEDITEFVHSTEDLERAKDISRILFKKGTAEELSGMTDQDIMEAFEGLPNFSLSKAKLVNGINIIELLAQETSICDSKSDARRKLKGNAISINKTKVAGEDSQLTTKHLIKDQFVLVQNGKKHFYMIRFE